MTTDYPLIAWDNHLAFSDPALDSCVLDWPLTESITPNIGSGASFTRATTATYIDIVDRLVKTAAIDTARFERAADGGPALLHEGTSTNLALYSEQFDNAWWNKTGAAITANTTSAPDDNLTADSLIEDTSTGRHRVSKSTLLTAGDNSLSVFLSANGRTQVSLELFNSTDGTIAETIFDLATGTITSAISGTSKIQSVGNGFYRCSVSGTSTVATGIFIQLYDGSSISYTGDGSSGVYIWGGQGEDLSDSTSYIPTTTASAARARDNLTLTDVGDLPEHDHQGATIVMESDLSLVNSNQDLMASVGRNYNYTMRVTSADAYTAFAGDLNSTAAITIPDRTKMVRYEYVSDGVNDWGQINEASTIGTTGTTGTSTGTITSINIFAFSAGTNEAYGHLRNIKIYKRPLSTSEFQNRRGWVSIDTGVESAGGEITEAATWDTLKPAIVDADEFGIIGIILWAYGDAPDLLIVGAHKHDSTGFRFDQGTVSAYSTGPLGSGASVILVGTKSMAGNRNDPVLIKLADISTYSPYTSAGGRIYRIEFTGLAPNETYVIPELFFGKALELPPMDYNYDESLEEWKGVSFTAENGRIYESALSRRYKADPVWGVLPESYAAAIETFREEHLEERRPFWWAWRPDTYDTQVYLMHHNARTAPMPRDTMAYRHFRLPMIESV